MRNYPLFHIQMSKLVDIIVKICVDGKDILKFQSAASKQDHNLNWIMNTMS